MKAWLWPILQKLDLRSRTRAAVLPFSLEIGDPARIVADPEPED